MSDIEAQKQISHMASMAAHNRILRTPSYIKMIDGAIERAAAFGATGEWPELGAMANKKSAEYYIRDRQQARKFAQSY